MKFSAVVERMKKHSSRYLCFALVLALFAGMLLPGPLSSTTGVSAALGYNSYADCYIKKVEIKDLDFNLVCSWDRDVNPSESFDIPSGTVIHNVEVTYQAKTATLAEPASPYDCMMNDVYIMGGPVGSIQRYDEEGNAMLNGTIVGGIATMKTTYYNFDVTVAEDAVYTVYIYNYVQVYT